MLEQITFKNNQELQNAQLTAIVNTAKEIYYSNGSKPVRILDLATGPNEFNPVILRNLIDKGIDYRLVLSDISPSHIRRGYRNLEEALTNEELKKVKVVLADSNNPRMPHWRIPIYQDDGPRIYRCLPQVLKDSEFYFLSSEDNFLWRNERFSTGSFDFVIGQIPYGSMQRYDRAIDESARVLKKGGYPIIQEWQVEKLKENAKRTLGALRGARIRHV